MADRLHDDLTLKAVEAFGTAAWTCKMVAQYLGTEESTVQRLHQASRLPGFRVGKQIRWSAADVVAFVLNRGRSEA